MMQKARPQILTAEHVIKDIRRATRKHCLSGDESIATLCRGEGIAESL